jgi:hypothetical protein
MELDAYFWGLLAIYFLLPMLLSILSIFNFELRNYVQLDAEEMVEVMNSDIRSGF